MGSAESESHKESNKGTDKGKETGNNKKKFSMVNL